MNDPEDDDDDDGDLRTATAPQAAFALPEAMARRMAELNADVREALAEMARICEQTVVRADPALGRHLQGQPSTLVYRPHRHGAGAHGAGRGAERLMDAVTVVRYGSGPGMSLCYNEVQGLCYRC